MASDSFIVQLRKSSQKPVIRFDYDGTDRTSYLINCGEIRRDINLTPGSATVTLDNADGFWNDLLTLDDELAKKAEITMGLVGFANVTLDTLSFVNGGASKDTIEDSAHALLATDFEAGMVFSVTGSDFNDGTYTIYSITDYKITLIASDVLTNESAGDSITLTTEELTLFAGDVIDVPSFNFNTDIVMLTIRDRLSLFLDNRVENIKTASITAATISFYENSTNDMTLNTLTFYDGGATYDFIEDSSNILNTGLIPGASITIANSNYNDGTYTVLSVNGIITLTSVGTLTDEAAGEIITVTSTGNLFSGAGTIIDSANGFVAAGFSAGQLATITNSTSNNVNIIPVIVAFGTMVILPFQALVDEAAGNNVNIVTASEVWLNYFDSTHSLRINEVTVSNLVWHLVTAYGKLDYTMSVVNKHIDYTSWAAWAEDVDDGGYTIYDIGICADGSPVVRDVVKSIMDACESVCYIGGNGKLIFKKARTGSPWRIYTDEILKCDSSISMSDRINSIYVKWGYHPTDGSWQSDLAGITEHADSAGPTNVPYTYNSEYIQDSNVFHNSDDSAYEYTVDKLNRTAAPPRIFDITTQLLGFVEDVRTDFNIIDIKSSPFNNISIQVNEIVYILAEWEVRINGQWRWS